MSRGGVVVDGTVCDWMDGPVKLVTTNLLSLFPGVEVDILYSQDIRQHSKCLEIQRK